MVDEVQKQNALNITRENIAPIATPTAINVLLMFCF